MNNDVYYIGYPEGIGGEFLSYLISQDSSFYPIILHTVEISNRYVTLPYYEGIKSDTPSLNPMMLYDLNYNKVQRKTILRSHYCGDVGLIQSIPRLVPVALDCNQQHKPFFFTLGIIKLMIATWDDYYHCLKIEKYAVQQNLKENNDVINFMWEKKYKNRIIPNEYHRLMVDDLVFNPEQYAPQWEQFFKLNDKLDINLIKDKTEKDKQIIERIMNMPLNNYLNGDWMSILKEKTAYNNTVVLQQMKDQGRTVVRRTSLLMDQ